MSPKCPNCGSVIYSRKNALCGVCGKSLPPELLFTADERQRAERDLAGAKRTRLSPPNDGNPDSSPPFLSSTDFGGTD
jgi:hypothetical protein